MTVKHLLISCAYGIGHLMFRRRRLPVFAKGASYTVDDIGSGKMIREKQGDD